MLLSSEFDGESEESIPDFGDDIKVRIALSFLSTTLLLSTKFRIHESGWRILGFMEALLPSLTGDREVAW